MLQLYETKHYNWQPLTYCRWMSSSTNKRKKKTNLHFSLGVNCPFKIPHLIFFARLTESLFTVQWCSFLSTASAITVCHIWAAQWGFCCWSMNTQELGFALSVCKIKSNSVPLVPLCCLERTQNDNKTQPAWHRQHSAPWHAPWLCHYCYRSGSAAINNAVGDNERASKVWDWLPWS